MILGVLLLWPFTSAHAKVGFSSIVIDASTGVVLSEMNADVPNHPASLTKIMTLYLTFEALKESRIRLDSVLPVSEHAANQDPSKLGLNPGDAVTVENLILGVVTKSANDAAVTLAEGIGGSESAFADRMSKKARELGMNATGFRNASGLPNPNQVTTARDMSILAQAVLHDFPQYYHYFSTPRFNYEGQVFENHNKLLKSYAGADGIKTGFIRTSGFNLVASAERKGRRLIGVVMGSQSPNIRNAQMTHMLDASFSDQPIHYASLPGKPVPGSSIRATASAGKSKGSTTVAKAAGPDRGWGIQVGAYSRFAPAHLAAAKAERGASRWLGHGKVIVDAAHDDNSTVYRARVMGLTEDRARRACATLLAKKMECVTVASDGTVMSAEEGDTTDQPER